MKALSIILAVCALVFAFRPAHAQTDPANAITRARAHIDAINLDSAVVLLRQALDAGSGATTRQRTRAFVLLGIAELILGRETDARQAFRLALQLDPQHRVDSLADLSGNLVSVFNAERVALGAQPAAAAARQTLLEIQGLPEGAALRVDGTPWPIPRGQVSPGVHRIEVVARGYESYRDTVAARAGATTTKVVRMTRAAPATLSVTSEPWGTVYLDGQRIGETPLIARPVDAGTYTLTVESPGRAPVTRQLQLPAGQLVRLPLLGSTGPAVRSSFPFTVADSLYRATRFDEALPVYRRILLDTALSLSDDQRAEAATRIGMIFYATARSQAVDANFDSAQTYFRTAYALAPDYTPSPGNLAPEVRSYIDQVREGAFRLAVALSTDTLVSPRDGRFRILVRPPRPARVTVRIISAEQGRVVYADTQSLEAARTFDWSVRAPGDSALSFGPHTVLVQATDSVGEASPTMEWVLTVAREPVDTTPMPAPILPSLLLPETEPIQRGWHLVRGLVFGAFAAVAVPLIATAPEFTEATRVTTASVVVGGSIAIGGIVGFLAGEKSRPSPENAGRNRQLLEEDARNRQAIARANADTRAAARIHLTLERVR